MTLHSLGLIASIVGVLLVILAWSFVKYTTRVITALIGVTLVAFNAMLIAIRTHDTFGILATVIVPALLWTVALWAIRLSRRP